jgi:hypothetical protein
MKGRVPRNPRRRDVLCKACSALLATIDDTGLILRRGRLEATVRGDIHASITCYRPWCQTRNALNLKTDRGPPSEAT